jgi:hypothetical protein
MRNISGPPGFREANRGPLPAYEVRIRGQSLRSDGTPIGTMSPHFSGKALDPPAAFVRRCAAEFVTGSAEPVA